MNQETCPPCPDCSTLTDVAAAAAANGGWPAAIMAVGIAFAIAWTFRGLVGK